MLKKIKYTFIVLFIWLIIFSLRFLPRNFSLFRFKMRGRFLFYLLKKERKRCMTHLTRAYYPEKSRKEIFKMSKEVFEHQAMNAADFIRSLHYNSLPEFDKIWEVIGEEHLAKAYQEGKGVLVSTPHLGCWEFSAIAPSLLGYQNCGVSAPLKSKRLNEIIIEARERRGMKNISRGKGKAGPQIIEELKKGACTIIMIDQDIKIKGCFIPFYGREAFTSVGAAKLAAQSGSPVISMYCKRKPDGKHQIVFHPAINLQHSDNYNDDLIENTKRIHTELENIIKKNPEQWVWMHRRWRRNRKTIESKLLLNAMSS